MKKPFEHFILQDLVDDHIQWLLRWIGRTDLITDEHRFQKVDSVMRVQDQREIRTDNAWLIEGPNRTIVSVEVQRYRDNTKLWRCDEYLAISSARHYADAILLFLTPDPTVAQWAKKGLAPIRRARGIPYVFGPQDVAVNHADFDPKKQLGPSFLLAAIGQHAEMFHLLWEEIKRRYRTKAFDQDAFYDYIQLLERTAPATWIRTELEDDMEFIGSIDRAKRDGRKEGEKDGVKKALQFYREGIRELAATRGITLTPDSESKLHTATEPEQLSRWLIEVGTAETSSLTLSDAEK